MANRLIAIGEQHQHGPEALYGHLGQLCLLRSQGITNFQDPITKEIVDIEDAILQISMQLGLVRSISVVSSSTGEGEGTETPSAMSISSSRSQHSQLAEPGDTSERVPEEESPPTASELREKDLKALDASLKRDEGVLSSIDVDRYLARAALRIMAERFEDAKEDLDWIEKHTSIEVTLDGHIPPILQERLSEAAAHGDIDREKPVILFSSTLSGIQKQTYNLLCTTVAIQRGELFEAFRYIYSEPMEIPEYTSKGNITKDKKRNDGFNLFLGRLNCILKLFTLREPVADAVATTILSRTPEKDLESQPHSAALLANLFFVLACEGNAVVEDGKYTFSDAFTRHEYKSDIFNLFLSIFPELKALFSEEEGLLQDSDVLAFIKSCRDQEDIPYQDRVYEGTFPLIIPIIHNGITLGFSRVDIPASTLNAYNREKKELDQKRAEADRIAERAYPLFGPLSPVVDVGFKAVALFGMILLVRDLTAPFLEQGE